MSKTTRDVLKVSDCHHATLIKVIEKDKHTGKYICAVCHQLCKVVELLVEEK